MSTSKSTKGNGRGYRHGLRKSPEYSIWQSMNRRCYEQSRADYPRYGGRGITVCQRWRDSVVAFYEDMGPRPSPKHSIDRIDCNGNYTPENCRWATTEQQCNNKRNNRRISHNGKTLTMTQWDRELGLSRGVVKRRIDLGWTIERSLQPKNFSNVVMLTLNGETLSISDWARKLGIKQFTLSARLRKGWTVEKALTTPVG